MAGTASETISNQQALWDAQHAVRGAANGLEGDHLVDVPNHSAVLLTELLRPGATIAEVGAANGRDARYWAGRGHHVHAMDFSSVALEQLTAHAARQGLSDRINPMHFDANAGRLPEEVGAIDSFYARSALHVDDDTLMNLLTDVDDRLNQGGVVFIEGKGSDDPKISRSVALGNGLAVDPVENGHVRRIWTPESAGRICSAFGWTALALEKIDERWLNTDASFVRLVAMK